MLFFFLSRSWLGAGDGEGENPHMPAYSPQLETPAEPPRAGEPSLPLARLVLPLCMNRGRSAGEQVPARKPRSSSTASGGSPGGKEEHEKGGGVWEIERKKGKPSTVAQRLCRGFGARRDRHRSSRSRWALAGRGWAGAAPGPSHRISPRLVFV